MAALMAASRGVFAARSMAPVRCCMVAPLRASTALGRSSTMQSSFLGGSSLMSTLAPRAPSRGALVVAANAKASMACTKRGTNRKRRRVSGFRTRMATAKGRKTLKARMKKGRHVIAPASVGKSGGKK